MKNLLLLITSVVFITSCGGGGGGGSTPLATTVSLTADSTSVLLSNSSTLTWSSTNANACTASGAWSGIKSTSGSEAVIISMAGSNTYSINCTGSGAAGSTSVIIEGYRNTDGVVVDGYISGAEVCIDEDESWTCDSTESSTTSDNDGKFIIKYANGNLLSIGGMDLDSQTLLDNLLLTHKLTGHSDFKAITPVTSVAAFMTDSSLVNAALGIDLSIDVFTFDPVANKGDGGINDYAFEKGNQLTVMAYALQNITNSLNTTTETTQDYFKAIAEEIEKEYIETTTKVDIETKEFIAKTLDKIVEAKTVTITDEAKANTTKALSGAMPVIEVKSSDDLTTSVIRFAVSTLQADIKAIANGTAAANTVASYTSDVLTYIAEDQNIDADKIAPGISAIADSASLSEDGSATINVVLNDSYLSSAPISVSSGNGRNGITTLAESSPEQVVYSPNADYNGTDKFTYTITQGEKTSSADVTVTIEAVNDPPSIDTASTIQVTENQTAVAIITVSDVDEDDLTLTLSGTDSESFDLSTDNILSFREPPDFETKSSYSITLYLTDGAEIVTKDLAISITNVNDIAPTISSDAVFNAAENQTAIGTVIASDQDGDNLVYSVISNDITISSQGILAFIEAPNYEAKDTYNSIVRVGDGENITTQDITVLIKDVNDAPVIYANTSIEVNENNIEITNINANDEDADTLSYSIIGGPDKLLVNIDQNGLLSFDTAANYESPTDDNEDNLYIVTVLVSDGNSESSSFFNITVKNVNEAPTIYTNYPNVFEVKENATLTYYVLATACAGNPGNSRVYLTCSMGEINLGGGSSQRQISDPEGDTLSYSISGDDADKLGITQNGSLYLREAGDYETQETYNFVLNVNDGELTTSKTLKVVFSDVAE